MSINKEDNILNIIERGFNDSKTVRSNYDNINQEIVDYIAPNRGDFTVDSADGDERADILYDSTAIIAAQDLVSILMSGLFKDKWFRFGLNEQNIDIKVKRLLEEGTDKVLGFLKNPDTRFYQQVHEFLTDLVHFGYACMQVGKMNGNVIYQTIHPGEVFFEEGASGGADIVYRKYKLTLRQAFQKWGEEIGKQAMGRLTENPAEEIDILHNVMPTEDFIRMGGTMMNKSHKFSSTTINLTDRKIIKISGFKNLPYVVARWNKRSGEVYGISPSWNIISDVKMLNMLNELYIKSEQKALDPPLLTIDELPFLPLETFPGGINPGGLNEDGSKAVEPFPTVGTRQSKIDVIVEKIQRRIESAYFVDQFRERQGVQPLTATETLDNRDKRLTLIGPNSDRIKIEFSNKIIELTVEGMKDLRLLPKGGNESDLIIEYIGTLSFTENSEKLLAYNRFFANAASFIQLDPNVIGNIRSDESIRRIAELSGIPTDDIKDGEEVDQERAAQQEQQARAEQFAQLESSAKSAKDLNAAGINITE